MSGADETPAERLVELESRYLHMDHLLARLNEVVVEQQASLEKLARQVATLREELENLRRDGAGA